MQLHLAESWFSMHAAMGNDGFIIVMCVHAWELFHNQFIPTMHITNICISL